MKKYHLKNMDCANCAAKIESNLAKLEEVKFVNINFASSIMLIDTDNLEKVKSTITRIEPGVEVNEKKHLVTTEEIKENRITIIKAISAVILLMVGLIFQDQLRNTPYGILEYMVFVAAYLISGWNVITSAIRNIIKGQVFNEQFLMTIATLGAFAINEMPEAVAVMLFYVVGEFFQDISVNRSRKSIRALLEIQPDYANVKSGSDIVKVSPDEVMVGDTILVKPGEKIPLDGSVITGRSFVDTAALTGESVPRKIHENDEVLAGMINQTGLLAIKVTKIFGESSISRILELVENATAQKAETEKFITTFARYYTPMVVIGALLIAVLPPLLLETATFSDWIYRALVVLVISCPCALVISIPLGYFGGVGGASKRGVLVKGSNFLDALTHVRTIVFDKTGTLTKGEFKVSEIITHNGFTKDNLLKYAGYAESNSNHPIAKSIIEAYNNQIDTSQISYVEEMSGYGVKSIIDGKEVLVGNDKMLHKENIDHPLCDVAGTVVHVVIEQVYGGYIIISDILKDGAVETIEKLSKKGIKTIMLTGDNEYAAKYFAEKLKIDQYYFNLLPEDKVNHVERIMKQTKDGKVAFVGDGINDAPVIARADVGIAMGALGSDAAIETADVVLMTGSPTKVIDALDMASKTRNIVWQNIIFAMGVKIIFILLGIYGIAGMWEAVFGDMGVALIAVFNALRILK